MFRLLSFLAVILLGAAIALPNPVFASDSTPATQLFEFHCAGCHINGGNIVRRGKTLKLGALQKNGYDSVEAIAAIVTNGKANMSAYKDRLTPAEITQVSAYVWEQAQKNWRG
jgi:cytochrome c6